MKYILKNGVNGKARVTYRVPGKQSMRKVILEKAGQPQLKILYDLGHEAVEEEKLVKKEK